MRPLWYEFPSDPNVFATDDSFMVGDALLVHPVARAGITASQVYLPGKLKEFEAFRFIFIIHIFLIIRCYNF